MFIGGGPAGTAGGIKITTFGVLFFIVVAEMRGRGAVNVFGKRLSRAVHRQAITVSLVAVAAVVGSTALLALLSDAEVDRLAFEAVSAFATAGLSTGITPDLPPLAQALLLVLMFAGRLGPILLASALAVRTRPLTYEFPKERPIIG
jgi:Trk-type K+ transport system membrane component